MSESEPKVDEALAIDHGLKPDECAWLIALIGRTPTFTPFGRRGHAPRRDRELGRMIYDVEAAGSVLKAVAKSTCRDYSSASAVTSTLLIAPVRLNGEA